MEGTEKELLNNVVEVVQRMGEAINMNTDAINEIVQFVNALAELSFKAVEIGQNNFNAMQGYVGQISERFELLDLMNNSQNELIEAVKQLTYLNTGLAVFNTVLIFVIGMVLIRRK